VCKLVYLNCLYYDKAIVCCVYCMKCAPASVNITRSQAVARIADRTSSQHFWGHVIGHTSRHHLIPHMPFSIGCPLDYLSLYLKRFPIYSTPNVTQCDYDMTLIRPLNKGQGHSFWYQSIYQIRLPIGCQ